MADLTETKKPNKGATENLPPDDFKINATPSSAVKEFIDSLNKTDSVVLTNAQKSQTPAVAKRRKYAVKTPVYKGKKIKRGRPSKKIAKKRGIKRTNDLRQPIKSPVALEKSRKKHVPASLFNFVFFSLLFAAFIAVNIIVGISSKEKIPLTVSPIAITPEEDVRISAEKQTETTVTQQIQVEKQTVVQNQEIAAPTPNPETTVATTQIKDNATEKIEEDGLVTGEGLEKDAEAPAEKSAQNTTGETPGEVAQKTDEIAKNDVEPQKEQVAGVKCEVVKVEEGKKIISKSPIKKKRGQTISDFYRTDPYTNGSPMDLDGHAARELYRAGNVVLVPVSKGTNKEFATKSLHQDPYNDINTSIKNGGNFNLNRPQGNANVLPQSK